jgi:protein-tyrosine phosphatase
MREAREAVAKLHGEWYAELLCLTNPLAAFLGQALGEQEEPLGLYDDMEAPTLWQRVRGKLTGKS